MNEKVAGLIKDALNDEWQAALQYDIHAAFLMGFHRDDIGGHLEEHADDERGHAKQLVIHLAAKGQTMDPSLEPPKLASSMEEMVDLDMKDEMAAIELYAKILDELGDDPEQMDTIMLIEGILADEVGHQDELAAFLGKEAKKAMSVQGRRIIAHTLAQSAKRMDSLGWSGKADKLTETALGLLS